jgi:acyl-coenzyme A synthetase/AMP-(fatty) acid ligase
VTPDDIALAISPPTLEVSLVEMFAPLTVGARLVIAESELTFDAERLPELAAASGATLMIAPTALWREIVTRGEHAWPALNAVCVGNIPDHETTTALVTRTASAWMAQGFREAGIWSTLHRLDGSEPVGLLGRPLPHAHVRMLDRDLRDTPLGLVGELCVGMAGCAMGYWGPPQPDDESFVVPAEGRRDVVYRTGERVRWRTDGVPERLKRREREVHLNGFRTNLEEISVALRQHPAVDDAAVALQTLRTGRSRVVGYVVPRGGRAYTDTELRQALKRTLPARMIPRAFIELDAIPRTTTGAVDLEHLGGDETSDEFVAPRSPVEALLARLWQEALGLPRVGIHDNFFALGGYSLLCFQVLERIERATGQRLNPRMLLLDSLQQVAARLETAWPAGGDPRKPEPSDGRLLLQRLGKLLPGLAYGIVGPTL